MFLFIFALREWKCDHNKMVDFISSLPPQDLKTVGKLKAAATTRTPINVHYDFRFIEDPSKDSLACTSAGKSITWGGYNYICTDEDIVTTAKTNIVKVTLNNVHDFLSSVLNVTKFSSFTVHGDPSHVVEANTQSGDADLYLTVYARPFGGPGSSTLASAGSYESYTKDNTEKRPQSGIVHINYALLPTAASNIDDEPRNFFEVCVHETVHALGFSSNIYSNWIDRKNNNAKYTKVNEIKNNPDYPQKKFNIFVTPKLVELFTNKFGTNSFAAGVEIEDGGGSGTAGSHFEMRTYYTELMCGQTIGYSFISEFTLGLLFDTGWYDVDFSKAEPFYYGNYKAVIGDTQPYTNFPFGPPDKYFPANYISNESKTACSYDHYFGGSYNLLDYNCETSLNSACCTYPTFTDSLDKKKCNPNNVLQDYVPLINPYSNRFCKDPTSFTDNKNFFNMEFGKNSFCAGVNNFGTINYGCYPMKCSSANELSITHKNIDYKCANAGESIKVDSNYNIICPDPKIICGIMNYKLNNGGSAPPPPLPETDPIIPPKPATDPIIPPKPATDPIQPPKPATDPIQPPKPATDAKPDVQSQQPGDNNNNNEDQDKPTNNGNNKGAIIGGIIAAIVVVVVVIVILFVGCRNDWWCSNNDSDIERAGGMNI